MRRPRPTIPPAGLVLVLTGAVAGLIGISNGRLLASDEHGSPETQSAPAKRSGKSITDMTIGWPTREELWRVIRLRDHNTRVVFAGTTALGAVGGLVGTFLLLRKRALLSDTISHATLPGVALAFLVAEAAGVDGKSLPVLLAGAALTGLVGMGAVAAIRNHSRVKDDAALAIVLSVFFGLGIALLVLIQQLPSGNAAGLKNYIYGKAASMTTSDAQLILWASLAVALVCVALLKEFKLLCFDPNYAAVQGWPVRRLDLLLMGLVVAVTVIGLQAVGLLLVVAMLIIPPAAARFWSERLTPTLFLAAVVGIASSFAGVTASALFPKLPAGAVIVLAAAGCFGISLVFGRKRGALVHWLEQRRVSERVGRQHLLRAFYECLERQAGPNPDWAAMLGEPVSFAELEAAHCGLEGQLPRRLRRAEREGLVRRDAGGGYCLASPGQLEARNVTRNHRLWELYLLNYADIAPQHIHRDADHIEHVVEPQIVNELEIMLAERYGGVPVPANPEQAPSAAGRTA